MLVFIFGAKKGFENQNSHFCTFTHTTTNIKMDDIANVDVANKAEYSKITADLTKSLILFILTRSKNEKGVMVPACGTVSEARRIFNVSKQNASKIWIQAKPNNDDPNIAAF
jgi:hypothetical protein